MRVFFVSKKLVSKNFGSLYKKILLRKVKFLLLCFSYWMETEFLKTKNNTHLNLVEVLAKKISALSVEPFGRKRGNTFVKF